ncbi:protein kinase domain-containing protein [Streptomyces sp. A5-4]|uniref:protein kinase domain-containing protein n=1 Tax=Streptomyces sp. A5-4 TaxID=3384771 RepID=UPI003DA85E40
MAAPLLPGDPRQLGTFYLDGRLGAGGQGVVYEGYAADGERVAVKALHGVSDSDRDMLRKETEAWRRVAPFCTAKMLHADLDGPIPFVVSEYVAGSDLRRTLDIGDPYEPEELRRLAIGVATALVAIHRAGVVHRDLKPENILLGPDGPRVIDFGIARIMEGTATAGLPMGTLRYMPPERCRGEHGDGKVDVWGWAAVVVFAATGRHAFDGENALALTYQVSTHEPDTSMLAEPLRSLVAASLSKKPGDRPTSEQLLLSLVGRADLADVVRGAAPGIPLKPDEPSRSEVARVVYDRLGNTAREATPRVLLRLVAPGERAEDTLRSARRTEFSDGQTPEQVLEEVLEAFTGAGILLWEGEKVALSSAALIRAWPRLRGWVEAERAGLGVHQRLSEASRAWDDHGHKKSDLLQGTALDRARDWAATGRRHLTLNDTERDFLDAGSGLARHRGRLRVLLSAVLSVLLVIAVGAATIAFDQRQTVSIQRDRATSAQVAGTAQSLRRTDPELGRRLAVASARLADSPESWSALLALRNQREDDALKLPGFVATESDLDSTGQTYVAAAGTRVEFWNVQSRRKTGSYTAPARVHQVDLSDDGRTAIVSTDDGYTRLLDVSTARLRSTHTYPTVKESTGLWPRAALSPLGTYLMAESIEATDTAIKTTMAIWDTRTGRKFITMSSLGPVSFSADSSFSPDERILSVPDGAKGKRFTWFDTHTKKKLPVPLPYGVKAADIQGPAVFSPDAKSVALTLKGGKINVFLRHLKEPLGTELRGAEDPSAYPLHFSHDGRFLVRNAIVWDTEALWASEPVMRYATTQSECHPLTALRFTADNSKLRCAGTDGVVRSLDIHAFTKPPESTGEYYQASAVSLDRRTFALSDGDGIEIWSTPSRTKRSTVTSVAGSRGHSVEEIQLSRDGRLLAVVADTQVEIWDTAKKKPALLGSLSILEKDKPDGAAQPYPFAPDKRVAFSPDNKSLAVQVVKAQTNTLTFCDLTTMRQLRKVQADLGYPSNGGAVFFQPDGKSVIAAPNLGRVAFPSGRVITKGASTLEVDSISDDGATIYTYPRRFRPYIRLWDARTLLPEGNDLRTGAVAAALSTPEGATAASSDGRLFATVHQSGPHYQIKVWNSRTRTQLGAPLTAYNDEIVALAFAPDGSTLTSVDKRGRFFTHGIAPAQLIRDLCAKSGPLTEQEWKTHIPDVPYRKTC